jgi:hypothetical protein
MTIVLVRLCLLGQALAAAAGCAPAQMRYEVSSNPSGATIFVDETQRGVTDEQNLLVTFGEKGYVTVRVEKPGYQPEGAVLTPEFNGPVRFFLKEAPQAESVLRKLAELESKLEQLSSRVNQLANK